MFNIVTTITGLQSNPPGWPLTALLRYNRISPFVFAMLAMFLPFCLQRVECALCGTATSECDTDPVLILLVSWSNRLARSIFAPHSWPSASRWLNRRHRHACRYINPQAPCTHTHTHTHTRARARAHTTLVNTRTSRQGIQNVANISAPAFCQVDFYLDQTDFYLDEVGYMGWSYI